MADDLTAQGGSGGGRGGLAGPVLDLLLGVQKTPTMPDYRPSAINKYYGEDMSTAPDVANNVETSRARAKDMRAEAARYDAGYGSYRRDPARAAQLRAQADALEMSAKLAQEKWESQNKISPWLLPEVAPRWARDASQGMTRMTQQDIDYIRQRSDVRGRQGDILDQLARVASGEDSIARRQSQIDREQAIRDAASAAASARGGMSPAIARAAQIAEGRALGDIASRSELAAAMERRDALARYGDYASSVGQQDTNVMDALRRTRLAQQVASIVALQAGYEQDRARAAGLRELENMIAAQDAAKAGRSWAAYESGVQTSNQRQATNAAETAGLLSSILSRI